MQTFVCEESAYLCTFNENAWNLVLKERRDLCAIWMNRSQKDVNKEQSCYKNIWLEITLSLDWHTNKNKQSMSNEVSTKRTTNHELAFTRTLPNADVRFQGCGVNLKCFMKFWSRISKWLHAETAFRLSKSFLWLFSLELKELLHLFNVLDICIPLNWWHIGSYMLVCEIH